MRNCPEPQRHNDNSSKIKRNNFNTCRNVRRHLQSSFSALKLLKLFHYFNLVSLKDSLITGFQGNTASKPVIYKNFVRAHFVFAANYGLPTPASFSKSFVSEKKSALCDGKLGPSSMLVPIVSVLNRDGKFTPRLLKQFWCSFNVSCSFGLQIFHPMMDHSIPVNIQAVVRILGFCKLSVL